MISVERYDQKEALLPITGIILCGGKSSRMGRPKAFLPYAGSTFIEHQIELARKTFAEFFLVTSQPDAFDHLGVRVIEDIVADRGPLGGILSGLLACQTPEAFVIACDMPLVDRALIRKIYSESRDCDACLLLHDQNVEPLFGIYRKSCIKFAENLINSGRLKMHDFLSTIALKTFEQQEDSQNGVDRLPVYFNVNSPEDYSRVLNQQQFKQSTKNSLSLSEAQGKISDNAAPLPARKLALIDVNGYYLAESIIARSKLPPFDNSAVDGFGVLLKDVEFASETEPAKLKCIGEMKAGSAEDFRIEPGTCLKILTGARVPDGVEAVVMQECCELRDGSVYVFKQARKLENIRLAGEEFAEGSEVMSAGVLASPPVVGLLANFGYEQFSVIEKPRVAIVTTGDELVQPGQPLALGQIYDSNSFTMRAAILALGITEVKLIPAKDTVAATRIAFTEAIEFADVVISSGGVSVGDYDVVKDVLEEIEVKTIFWGVKIKPGEPVYFGTTNKNGARSKKLVFGLPGNPVALLVTYHQLVKPALLKMMGKIDQSSTESKLRARLLPENAFKAGVPSSKRRTGERVDLVRATLSTTSEAFLVAKPTIGQDSHMLSGLAKAECLLHLKTGTDAPADQAPVVVEPIEWNK
jgi:molybdopterin molybdotransferase